jgi:hypothetical protein
LTAEDDAQPPFIAAHADLVAVSCVMMRRIHCWGEQ